jgi:tRNA-dihydrouridine synthase 4
MIVQLGVNSPVEISRTATMVAPYAAGIDINCGCPQSWACAETLGAALMHQRELVASMVSSAKATLTSLYPETHDGLPAKTVSVKIRIHKDLRETVDFVKTVQDAGVDFITIHGRTRSQRSSEPVNVEAVKLVASHINTPKILNGDVVSLSSAHSLAVAAGVDGVMAARGLLENPALFAGQDACTWETVDKFMEKVVRKPLPFKLTLHHVSEMTGGGELGRGSGLLSKAERLQLWACKDMLDLIDFLEYKKESRR